jgi:hypothetical protein
MEENNKNQPRLSLSLSLSLIYFPTLFVVIPQQQESESGAAAAAVVVVAAAARMFQCRTWWSCRRACFSESNFPALWLARADQTRKVVSQ